MIRSGQETNLAAALAFGACSDVQYAVRAPPAAPLARAVPCAAAARAARSAAPTTSTASPSRRHRSTMHNKTLTRRYWSLLY